MIVKLLKGFGFLWIVLAGLFVGAGIFGVWMKDGFSGVQELMSPYNFTNLIVTLITFAPGFGALMWAEKLKDNENKDKG